VPSLSRRRGPRRDQTDRVAAPRVDHDQQTPQGIHADGHVASLCARQVVFDGDGCVVLKCRRCVGEVDAVLVPVGGGLPAVPLNGSARTSLYAHLCTEAKSARNARVGACEEVSPGAHGGPPVALVEG
jgi:hypothetical protein